MIRQGRKNPHTLYRQYGPEPTDDDPFIGTLLDPETLEDIVEKVNGFNEAFARVGRLEQELDAAIALSDQRGQEIQRLQRPLMTNEQKADTEDAFQRGVEHARTAMGQNKYALNRDGIKLVGKADQILATAIHAIQSAQAVLGDGVKTLSEDAPAKDGLPNTIGKTHVCVVPSETGRCVSANCPEMVATAPAVTPEAVAAQAPDEADDDCRCDELIGLCRTHDVGRS